MQFVFQYQNPILIQREEKKYVKQKSKSLRYSIKECKTRETTKCLSSIKPNTIICKRLIKRLSQHNSEAEQMFEFT